MSDNREFTLGTFTIRPVQALELYNFCDVLMDATSWFERNGERVWSRRSLSPHALLSKYRLDELYLAYLGDDPVAAMIMNNRCDWPVIGDSERRNSLFVHKIAVKRNYAGLGLSQQLLQWARAHCLQSGHQLLMLTCDCQSPKLRQHWQTLGFDEVESLIGEDIRRHYVFPVKDRKLGAAVEPNCDLALFE
jgi:GNAT superfamily N-acetyltransferase